MLGYGSPNPMAFIPTNPEYRQGSSPHTISANSRDQNGPNVFPVTARTNIGNATRNSGKVRDAGQREHVHGVCSRPTHDESQSDRVGGHESVWVVAASQDGMQRVEWTIGQLADDRKVLPDVARPLLVERLADQQQADAHGQGGVAPAHKGSMRNRDCFRLRLVAHSAGDRVGSVVTSLSWRSSVRSTRDRLARSVTGGSARTWSGESVDASSSGTSRPATRIKRVGGSACPTTAIGKMVRDCDPVCFRGSALVLLSRVTAVRYSPR